MTNIDLAYIQRLIDDGVSEGSDIEYKSLIQVENSRDKKEFLADVSSFANTSGGDLILGIEEEHGVPTKVLPLQIADVDLELQRLDNLIRDGIRPRISYEIKVINVDAGKILVIRIDRSWNAPHRVVFEGWDKFFARNSAGKYQMDVDQLGESFARSQGVTERLRAFRNDRINAIGQNAMPFQIAQGGRIIVHCIPVDAFASTRTYDVLRYEHDTIKLRPLVDVGGYFTRITLEGIMSVSGQPWTSYMHLYRNGIIEGVDSRRLGQELNGSRKFSARRLEEAVLKFIPDCFGIYRSLEVRPPIVVAVTLVGVLGLENSRAGHDIDKDYYPIDRPALILPEIVVDSLDEKPAKLLKESFDLIWNACGRPHSPHFDENGDYK